MQLCGPARFYVILATVSTILIFLQNIGSPRLHIGSYSYPYNPLWVLVYHLLYIGIWTFVLTLLCKISPTASWALVLFPYVLIFVMIGFIFEEQQHESRGTSQYSIVSCAQCGKSANALCVHCQNIGLVQ